MLCYDTLVLIWIFCFSRPPLKPHQQEKVDATCLVPSGVEVHIRHLASIDIVMEIGVPSYYSPSDLH